MGSLLKAHAATVLAVQRLAADMADVKRQMATTTVTTTTQIAHCAYTLSECTDACEVGASRTITVTRQPSSAQAKQCPSQANVPDCLPGSGLCPTTSTTATTKTTTTQTTKTITTTTTTTPDPKHALVFKGMYFKLLDPRMCVQLHCLTENPFIPTRNVTWLVMLANTLTLLWS